MYTRCSTSQKSIRAFYWLAAIRAIPPQGTYFFFIVYMIQCLPFFPQLKKAGSPKWLASAIPTESRCKSFKHIKCCAMLQFHASVCIWHITAVIPLSAFYRMMQ